MMGGGGGGAIKTKFQEGKRRQRIYNRDYITVCIETKALVSVTNKKVSE